MDEDFVTTEWLAGHLDDPALALVDCTAFLPGSGRDARAEYAAAHIPGARFLDIAEVADASHPAPHMLPGAAQFARQMEALGVGHDDRIVVYDHSPLRTAARGWFMLRHFGARDVRILDGGLGKWQAEGRALTDAPPRHRAVRFAAEARPGEVVTRDELLADPDALVVDARSLARFEGREADPRPGVAPGHRPGARCLPMSALYAADGTFLPAAELAPLFAAIGVDPHAPFIASCGSGVTANSLLLAARRLGGAGGRLYDGSWSEWGADPATPKAVGPASRGR